MLTKAQAEEVKKAVRKMIKDCVKADYSEVPCVLADAAIDSLVEPEKPQWKAGDFAYCTIWNEIVHVTETGDHDFFRAANLYGAELSGDAAALRPLQDADWVRTIAGVKARAYDGNNGGIVFRTSALTAPVIFNIEERGVAMEFCRLAGIPIMPTELSHGKFNRPE